MTSKAADKLKSDGWKMVETSGFLHLVGPLWQRSVDGEHEYALADRGTSTTTAGGLVAGRRADDLRRPQAAGHDRPATSPASRPWRPWQLDVHFLSKPARSANCWCPKARHVVRSTRSLIFITTEVKVDKTLYRGWRSGVFKILKNESLRENFSPVIACKQTQKRFVQGSEATKAIHSFLYGGAMDCFASLAMTATNNNGNAEGPTRCNIANLGP